MIRITPKEAQGMYDAYNKVYAPKEEPNRLKQNQKRNLQKNPNQVQKNDTFYRTVNDE